MHKLCLYDQVSVPCTVIVKTNPKSTIMYNTDRYSSINIGLHISINLFSILSGFVFHFLLKLTMVALQQFKVMANQTDEISLNIVFGQTHWDMNNFSENTEPWRTQSNAFQPNPNDGKPSLHAFLPLDPYLLCKSFVKLTRDDWVLI